ncbi:MAG: DUF6712 family protein [Bacteroides sp.]|uniref:DUF6712 family protein n=1 Tax=Bacteroides sp. TaxID=29523 RepID=UPI002FCBCD61
MILQTTKEIRELTGNYFANNDFGKIVGEIEMATEELAELIGQEVYKQAEGYYQNNSATDEEKELVRKVQRPIAIMATLRMYQKNDLSHEDDGRKFKIDSNSEKLPWEWQLDRDDARHLEDYYKSVDVLIRYLNKKGSEQWTKSRAYKESQKLLIRNGQEFDTYFPIEKSERTYLMLVPYIKEVQMLHTKRAYGPDKWDELLSETAEEETEVHYAACKATALMAMSLAMARMQLKVVPAGVVRSYVAESGAMASEPATMADIKLLADWIKDDAMGWLDEMKRARDGGDRIYKMLPENDKRNKFVRL